MSKILRDMNSFYNRLYELDMWSDSAAESLLAYRNDKALRILKFMQQCGYATKIGREYYTMQMQLDEFMTQSMGKSIYV